MHEQARIEAAASITLTAYVFYLKDLNYLAIVVAPHVAPWRLSFQTVVYDWCMSRTNMDIDDEACAVVMRRYCLTTKREAVNFALRALASEPLGIDEARQLRGSGWDGDLGEMRTSCST